MEYIWNSWANTFMNSLSHFMLSLLLVNLLDYLDFALTKVVKNISSKLFPWGVKDRGPVGNFSSARILWKKNKLWCFIGSNWAAVLPYPLGLSAWARSSTHWELTVSRCGCPEAGKVWTSQKGNRRRQSAGLTAETPALHSHSSVFIHSGDAWYL